MKTVDRISILISAYRNAHLLKRCLDSLAASFHGELPEVVVVDDSPGDAEIRQVVGGFAKCGIKFTVMRENGGFAGACNAGLPLCTREFVVLVNTDIIFCDEPFTSMLDFMDAHPKVGICQGTVVIKDGREADGKLNGCGAFLTRFGVNTSVGWLAEADDPCAKEARKCFAAYGALFMIRREMLASLGGTLFHGFFHSYYEEVDLCHRAWLAGWEVWYVPTPVVGHIHGASTWKFIPREDILRRFYRNIRFSYLTCFGVRRLLTIYPTFELLAAGQALLPLFRWNATHLRAHLWALGSLLSMAGKIWRTRRHIQRDRKIGEKELMKIIGRPYPLKEFLNSVRCSM